jgi:hypothetical protein
VTIWHTDGTECPLDELLGKTLIAVVNEDNETILFRASDGSAYALLHRQDCCERVHLEDIAGSLDDLLYSPILKAEVMSSNDTFNDFLGPKEGDEWGASFTWTFYHIGTIKGTVVLRWYGTSSGYYSERVDFLRTASPFTKVEHD